MYMRKLQSGVSDFTIDDYEGILIASQNGGKNSPANQMMGKR